jgi:hypothetical protein
MIFILQVSLKRMFAFVAIACVFVSVPTCHYRAIEGDYLLADFDCGNNRSIRIYAESFCDQADIPTYEVRQGEEILSQKYSANLSFDCGHSITAKDLALIMCEDGRLAVIVQVRTGRVSVIHDFASGKSYPKNPLDRDELKARVVAAIANSISN